MKKFLLIAISSLFISNFCIPNKVLAMQENSCKIIHLLIQPEDNLIECIKSLSENIDDNSKNNFAIHFLYFINTNLDTLFWGIFNTIIL